MTVRNTIPLYDLYGEQTDRRELLPFNIQRIETFLEETGTFHHAHRHPDLFQWVWVKQGKGQHRIDLQKFEMRPNLLFALHPGIVHDCLSERDMEGYILHFSPEILSPEAIASLGGAYYKVLEVPVEGASQINTLFEQMLVEVNNKQEGYEILIKALIHVLIVHANRWPVIASVTPTVANSLQGDFNQLLERWYKKERSIQAYADKLQVSLVVLNQTIKAFTGMTASEQIQKRIILEAKRQLSYTRQSVSEIAYALGFEDPNYFWKYFKRYTGLTPGIFRRQKQNDRK